MNRLRLASTAALVPLLVSRPAALLTQTLRPADPRHWLPGAQAPAEIPFVPWPQSRTLLEVLEGSRAPAPRLGGTEVPSTFEGRPALPFGQGQDVLEWTADRLTQVDQRLAELQALVQRALQADPGEFTRLDIEARARIDAIGELTHRRRHGLQPLASSGSYWIFFPDTTRPPRDVETKDFTPAGLGLEEFSLRRRDLADWLDLLAWNRELVELAQEATHNRLDDLLEGNRPSRGARGIEALLLEIRAAARQAADGTLNSAARVLIQADVDRAAWNLHRTVDESRFSLPGESLAAFVGGRVWLGRENPASDALLLDLPDLQDELNPLRSTAHVETITGATALFASLENTIAVVTAERERLFEAMIALRME